LKGVRRVVKGRAKMVRNRPVADVPRKRML